ncbi:VCBS repeat-containing protein [Candidatus Falkowbacteria bacterium]|nr:VCBS repeat-containing protein [Candidatus Falkowbacteria bacterium]
MTVLTATVFSLTSYSVQSRTDGYPKLANYFLQTPISDADAMALARWDVVILGMQAQDTSPQQIQKIRQLNPQVKILAYVASQEFPASRYTTLESAAGPWHALYAGIAEQWWLLRPDGTHFSSWPGNWSLNVTNSAPVVNNQRWNTYLPQFLHDTVMSTGLWDGIFYDNVWGNVAWVGDGQMDANRDGVKDDAAVLDSAWKQGMDTLLNTSRTLEGNNKIIIGNCRDLNFKTALNGCLIENAYLEAPWNNWSKDNTLYAGLMVNPTLTPLTVINNNTGNTGAQSNYRLMRYGLGSALLQNGYYSFDFGTNGHHELWWYDEYDVNLGTPVSASYQVNGASLWRRDFEQGAVFVNPTDQKKIVLLQSEELEKLSGTQDSQFNDGSIVNYVLLEGRDGGVYRKRVSEVIGSAFVNGYFARIFNRDGVRQQGGFYTSKSQYPSSTQIIVSDVDRDGELETLVAHNNRVEIYNSAGVKEKTFYPYGEKYTKGINISIGDLNGDDTQEIVTGTENGGGPHIRVFNDRGDLINPGFFAYGRGYRGGVNVAVGDLNGDGINEIIAGAGVSGGPHIRVFNKDGKLLSAGWFAYDPAFRGGVNVAVGDLNNDGKDEIVSGPGRGGLPEVKVWDSAGHQIGAPFMAFDQSNRNGVEVIVNDVNRDGVPEILATGINVF